MYLRRTQTDAFNVASYPLRQAHIPEEHTLWLTASLQSEFNEHVLSPILPIEKKTIKLAN